MPSSPTLAARNARILAGHAAGATVLDLALAEQVDPATVRRVLAVAGQTPRAVRNPEADHAARCLADPAWLRAEYATKSAQQIARELGCPRARVYEALHAAGIAPRVNGHGPKRLERTAPETADRIVSLYLAGSSARRIADELGVTVQLVGAVVEERGVKRSRSEAASLGQDARRRETTGEASARPPREWSSALRAEVLQRYARGQSGELIADLLELPASSVYRLLREEGVLQPRGQRPARPKAKDKAKAQDRPELAPGVREILPADQAAEALARYAQGEAPRAIAVVLGVPASRIYRLLRERGVLRTPSEARALRYEPGRAARELERLRAEAEKAKRAQVEAELADKVVERYAAGESGPAIGEALGLGAERVYTILRKRGVLRSRVETMQVRAQTGAISGFVGKPAEPLASEVEAEVLARYAAGEGGTAIARALGLKQWQVYELLRERGAMRSIGETKRMGARRKR